MAGFFDYLLGRDEYAPDAPIDPTTGLRPADRRNAALQALGNFSAVLSQAGAAQNPQQAAAAWSMMPAAVGAGQTYLDALTKERRVLQQEQGLRNLMRDPEQLRGLGMTDQQMALLKVLAPAEAAKVFGQVAFRDQTAKKKAELELKVLENQAKSKEQYIKSITNNPNLNDAQKQALLANIGTSDYTKNILFPETKTTAKSDLAKLLAEQSSLPIDDPRREIYQSLIDEKIGKKLSKKDKAGMENTLRDDLRTELEDYSVVNNGWQNIVGLANKPSGFSDYGLIVSFVKVLDPGSVVKEGEVKAAESNMGQLIQRFGAQIENAFKGEGSLTPEMRQRLIDTAASLYQNRKDTAFATIEKARATASNMNLNFENVMWGAVPKEGEVETPNMLVGPRANNKPTLLEKQAQDIVNFWRNRR